MDAEAPSTAPILFTVFLTGAAVMVVEIVGTRVLSPVFGVGIYVWSAQLAVTMGALALGYFLGGALADERPGARSLFGTILGAGIAVALAPVLARPVLALGDGFGLRAGTLLCGSALFGPALVALGMVGPQAVKLANRSLATGRAAGRVYAVSTVGSLVATVATGFYLVPNFDQRHILLATAAALVLLSIAFARGAGRLLGAAALSLPALGWAEPVHALPANVRVLARTQSLYGELQVIEDTAREVRYLRTDHSLMGAMLVPGGESAFLYPYVLAALPRARPRARTALQIGLGAGLIPNALAARGLRCDSVELDGEVVRLAREHFGFAPNGEVFVEDARTFLRRTDRRYDLVVHDTFTGGCTPAHLLSIEVMERIRALLEADGILALNMVGCARGPKARASQTVARTLRAVFPVVRCFADRLLEDPENEVTNLVFFASDSAIEFDFTGVQRTPDPYAARVFEQMPSWEISLEDLPDGALARDAHNPLERYQLPIAEDFYVQMKEKFPAAVWLN